MVLIKILFGLIIVVSTVAGFVLLGALFVTLDEDDKVTWENMAYNIKLDALQCFGIGLVSIIVIGFILLVSYGVGSIFF